MGRFGFVINVKRRTTIKIKELVNDAASKSGI